MERARQQLPDAAAQVALAHLPREDGAMRHGTRGRRAVGARLQVVEVELQPDVGAADGVEKADAGRGVRQQVSWPSSGSGPTQWAACCRASGRDGWGERAREEGERTGERERKREGLRPAVGRRRAAGNGRCGARTTHRAYLVD
eukprot:5400484-Prymnesium_polylepis.1